MGQGSDTAMAQIAGEVLHMAAESITVVHPDTDVTPYDMATLGSRSTVPHGQCREAARRRTRATSCSRCRRARCLAETTPIPDLFRKKYGMQAGNVVGIGSYIPAYKPPDHATG